jgi:4'-phosphopantetheinyl transferase
MSAGLASKHGFAGRNGTLPVQPDTIALWWADIDWPDERIASAWCHLSADERERACRYRRLGDRNRFIAARSCLRDILSSYLGVTARAIAFECGEHGKPRLAGDFADRNLYFNVAHSDGLAVIAVAADREIGIDVERVEPKRNCVELADRFFAPPEQQAIRDLALEDRVLAFYRCWTRKEAYLKAIGEGLFVSLGSFVVSVTAEDSSICVRDPSAAPIDCRVIDISPTADFAATLAISRSGAAQYQITQFVWSCSPTSVLSHCGTFYSRSAPERRTQHFL